MSGRTERGNEKRKQFAYGLVAALIGVALLLPSQALAHASDRGHVLLLPTGYYVVGGACAVAASFLAMVLLRRPRRRAVAAIRLAEVPAGLRIWTSLLSFLMLAVLLAAGFWGSRDPLSNPLPLTVWTIVWIGLTLVQGVFGNLWRWIDPWYGPLRLLAPILPAPRRLPSRLASWPAALLLLAFAWFELVYPAPDDPYRLAIVLGAYWLLTFAAMATFGHAAWSRQGEFLSVFFRLISAYAIVSERDAGGRVSITAGLPGTRPEASSGLSLSEAALLLAALASVSFDGFMRTFVWLGAIGVNPLEYPGRSAVVLPNTLGLSGAAMLLSSLFFACLAAGRGMAGGGPRLADLAGRLVWSLVPIALAFHFAHYLVALLVNGQYALVAFSDPFSLGWDLFGTAHAPVMAGIAMGSDAAWVLWNLQAGVIVLGHVAAVLVCHSACAAIYDDRRRALLVELPLTVLMIFYTVFGLWLLSTPTGA
ncbi:MAG: hypothetical protein KF914_04780 [Rhizobiaceae bacterium]|nr:hypothetical protein [Rhizobiaceae bacterium]